MLHRLKTAACQTLASSMLLGLSACTPAPRPEAPQADTASAEAKVTETAPVLVRAYRGDDDLLTAGLGHAGLMATAPAPADPEQASSAELRRRAIHTNWRGIVDLVGSVTEIPNVPGREFSSLRTVPGATHPHRVLAQIPDDFDTNKPCLIVTASSGSRGIYGAIGSVGDYALRRRCAVVYTDKGAGTDWFDLRSQRGPALDGRLAEAGQSPLFQPTSTPSDFIAFKHAHSQDLPEADWGQHVLQAAAFGLEALNQAFPERAPFTRRQTRVIAFGLSNGGAAVLRAAEEDQDGLLDAAVAAAPNIQTGMQPGLLDYGLQAAILQPCALLAGQTPAFLPEAAWKPKAEQRCRSLKALGWIRGADLTQQARAAAERLRAFGFTDDAGQWAGMIHAFDSWRSVVVSYAQSYARASVETPICGYRYALVDATGQVRAASLAEQTLWWSDTSGLPPSAGVQIVDTMAAGADPTLPGLLCLHHLREGGQIDPTAKVVAESLNAIRASARLKVPTVIVHGQQDALIPIAFSSEPYVAAARDAGISKISLWRVPKAQHFDAFLALPAISGQAKPLLPVAHEAMDQVQAYLDGGAFPTDR